MVFQPFFYEMSPPLVSEGQEEQEHGWGRPRPYICSHLPLPPFPWQKPHPPPAFQNSGCTVSGVSAAKFSYAFLHNFPRGLHSCMRLGSLKEKSGDTGQMAQLPGGALEWANCVTVGKWLDLSVPWLCIYKTRTVIPIPSL